MSLPKRVYREYMPSPKSMAGQLHNVEKVVKEKYVGILNQDYPGCPYTVLQADCSSRNLKTLLGFYTNDMLKNIIRNIGAGIKKNVKKELLITALVEEIAKSFTLLIEIMNDSMYQLLIKFSEKPQVPVKDSNEKSVNIEYLVLRGYLFQSLSLDEEVFVLPEELQHILKELDKDKTGQDVKRNTTICKMGANLLSCYGVMDEYNFYRYLRALFHHLDMDKPHVKINFSNLKHMDYYNVKVGGHNLKLIFENYAGYARDVNRVYFDDRYQRTYYSYYSVFDPYNIYFEQQRKEELDFLPLSCNDLLDGHFPDKKAKDVLAEYLIKQLGVNSIKAYMLAEEWSCYIKNGENPSYYLSNCLQGLQFNSPEQLNEFLALMSLHFANELQHWREKGHSPVELMGIKPERQGMQVHGVNEGNVSIKKEVAVKAGRNSPCPCGSGKKYKKCCGG